MHGWSSMARLAMVVVLATAVAGCAADSAERPINPSPTLSAPVTVATVPVPVATTAPPTTAVPSTLPAEPTTLPATTIAAAATSVTVSAVARNLVLHQDGVGGAR